MNTEILGEVIETCISALAGDLVAEQFACTWNESERFEDQSTHGLRLIEYHLRDIQEKFDFLNEDALYAISLYAEDLKFYLENLIKVNR